MKNMHDEKMHTWTEPRLRELYSAAQIAARNAELGRSIAADYEGRDLTIIGVLKGSFVFVADLVRQIPRPLQVDFLVASSYGAEKVSSGRVRLVYDPETRLEGKHILLVEDIIDSGRTLNRLLELLAERQPRSLEICALLDKGLAAGVLSRKPKFLGFEAPNEFLVGYGLDHAEDFRHLPFVASLAE